MGQMKRMFTEQEEFHGEPDESGRLELELTRGNIALLADIHSGRWPETVLAAPFLSSEVVASEPESRRCVRCGQPERRLLHGPDVAP